VIAGYVPRDAGTTRAVTVDTQVRNKGRRGASIADGFSLLLPVRHGEPTHVVELSGAQIPFSHALADAIVSGDEAVQPLLLPVEATPLGKLADILNALGEASVQSIDPLPNDLDVGV
jgi:hypothetical protein